MDFTHYIRENDNAGLQKYIEDGGEMKVTDCFGIPFY
jgi:hypothetical protein